MSVIVETTIGDIVIDLFVDERPRASLNFLKLCKVKFYNFCLFHFVQSNFLAQTGDPSGSGQGGESIFRSLYGDQARYFEAETKPRLKHVKKGTVSMVNNGNDMHGSQFFITLGENLDYLDGKHTVFGEVAEGLDILDKLNAAICDEKHRPYQDIRITHTVILDDPFDDPNGLEIPDRSPEPTKDQLDSGRIGADEEIDDTKGKTIEEINEMIQEKEFKAGTQILEMVGDIPDADVKPPENVLFVCKLNPVTTDDDLEIIFSRFGPIKSCEIIKDSVSQESLQYAFIEYENVEDCERAYFKMDNVLIDDRRIHVDFSQSVARVSYGKPGSKPVYKLMKEDERKKSTLTLKDRSKDDKYQLVFNESDSDTGNGRRKPGKTQTKRTSSSDDESPRKRRGRRDNDGRDNADHRSQDRRRERQRRAVGEFRPKDRGERRDSPPQRYDKQSISESRTRRHSSSSSDTETGHSKKTERRAEHERSHAGHKRSHAGHSSGDREAARREKPAKRRSDYEPGGERARGRARGTFRDGADERRHREKERKTKKHKRHSDSSN